MNLKGKKKSPGNFLGSSILIIWVFLLKFEKILNIYYELIEWIRFLYLLSFFILFFFSKFGKF